MGTKVCTVNVYLYPVCCIYVRDNTDKNNITVKLRHVYKYHGMKSMTITIDCDRIYELKFGYVQNLSTYNGFTLFLLLKSFSVCVPFKRGVFHIGFGCDLEAFSSNKPKKSLPELQNTVQLKLHPKRKPTFEICIPNFY